MFRISLVHQKSIFICLKKLEPFNSKNEPVYSIYNTYITVFYNSGIYEKIPLVNGQLSTSPSSKESILLLEYSLCAQLALVPDRKLASQADSEPPYEEVYWAKKNFFDLFNAKIM